MLMRLYKIALLKHKFGVNLEKILLPVYNSAKNAGFKDWFYSDEK